MGSNGLDNISILVVGYDGYIDVWNNFFDLMNKYWKDRPKTYLATSELKPYYKNVEVIPAGSNSEWSNRARNALKYINTPYVLLMLEDFYISDYVDNDKLKEVMNVVIDNDILYYQVLVQLLCQKWERGKAYKGNRRIHIIPKDKKYGINLQAAIWKTDYLRETIGCGNYNAWEFEIKQLKVNNCNEDRIEYLIDDRNILNITHAIVQSKYLRGAVKKMERIGHNIDLSERSVLSIKEDFKYNLKLFMYSVIPRKMHSFAKKIGRVFNIDFVTDRMEKIVK